MSSITFNFNIIIDVNTLKNLLDSANKEKQVVSIPVAAPVEVPANVSSPAAIASEPVNEVIEMTEEIPATPSALGVQTPAPAPPAPQQVQRKKVRWVNKTITLVPEETITSIVERIETGAFCSPSYTIDWYHKHHPLKERCIRIVDALRKVPNRSLSFQNLLAQTGLRTSGDHSLQNYLREMDKQGIITYSPLD